MDLEFYKKFDNYSDSELANYYVDFINSAVLKWGCRNIAKEN